MAATIIDGKAIAAGLRAQVAERVSMIAAAGRRAPGLALVLVGDNPASRVYVKSKMRLTREAGIRSFDHLLPVTISQSESLDLVALLNEDDGVDGILVQLPLPSQIDSSAVLNAIDPAKDVDGFHPLNAGRLMTGQRALVPCTPKGCMALIRSVQQELAGLHAVVVGRSNIVGKPMAQLLLAADCTVTIAHSRTRDLAAVCREADVLVAAVGRAGMIGAEHVKPGAIVIDVGINRTADGALVGDVRTAEVAEVARAITPVPGGVGPMTIACLLQNTVEAYERRTAVEIATPAASAGSR